MEIEETLTKWVTRKYYNSLGKLRKRMEEKQWPKNIRKAQVEGKRHADQDTKIWLYR